MMHEAVPCAPPLYEETVYSETPHRPQFYHKQTRNAHKWNVLFTIVMILVDCPVFYGLFKIERENYTVEHGFIIALIVVDVFLLFVALYRNVRCLKYVEVFSHLNFLLDVFLFTTLLVGVIFLKPQLLSILDSFLQLTTNYTPKLMINREKVVEVFNDTSKFAVLLLRIGFDAFKVGIRAYLAKKVIQQKIVKRNEMKPMKAMLV